MSDTKDAFPEYSDRTEPELDALRDTVQRTPIRGPGYVAPPAPGHDTKGLWHTFDAHGRTGYTAQALSLHSTLDALGYRTQLIPHRFGEVDIDRFPKDRSELFLRWTKGAVGKAQLCFASHPPHHAQGMRSAVGVLVPYCAFEGDVVSKSTARMCRNEEVFREIWVVSDFVRSAFLNAGVPEGRVVTVPPVLFGGPWPEARTRVARADGPFVFGTVGTWQKRKGLLDLARAYFGSFRRDQNVVLRIHTSSMKANDTIRIFQASVIADLRKVAAEFGDMDYPASKKMPRIELELGTDKSDEELIEWIGNLDCYVAPSHGEGLGIPAIWAKGMGVPVIATGFGALGDMIRAGSDTDNETLVPHRMEDVDPEIFSANAMFGVETKWGVYDAADLGKAMARAFERGRVEDKTGAALVVEKYGLTSAKARVKEQLGLLIDLNELTLSPP
jgi:glycosyltransferase involved in cell wall biosynthesis